MEWNRVHEDKSEDEDAEEISGVDGTADTRSGKAYMPFGKSQKIFSILLLPRRVLRAMLGASPVL